MIYEIYEGEICDIKKNGFFTKIVVEDISLIFNKEYKKIIELAIKKDETLKRFQFSNEIYCVILDYVFGDAQTDILFENLNIKKIPLYSIIYNIANGYKMKYQIISDLDNAYQITFKCNKNNLFNILSLVFMFNRAIILDTTDISLEEYKKILSSFDFKMIEGLNIKVNYQKQNSYIEPKILYETALLICNISEDIKNTNLSPFEKIIYAYDIVKNRKYKNCDNDLRKSRDLDKILIGEAIVCVGYSNFLNAILKCLDIKSIPLIDVRRCHQCNLVYIKDSKYDIDGIYMFDPTGDRRRNDNNDYISNYKYFATIINLKVKDIFGDILKTFSLDYDKMIKRINDSDLISNTMLDNLEVIFKFINIDSFSDFVVNIKMYEFTSNEEKKRMNDIYSYVLSKFSIDEIDIDTFTKALYNARRVEYYNNIIEEIDMQEIFKAVYNRFTYLQAVREKKVEKDEIIYLLKTRFYRDRIADNLLRYGTDIIESTLDSCESISRDKENIKLLKVLRNRQKQLTGERK